MSSSAFVYSPSDARLFDTRETFSPPVKIYMLQSWVISNRSTSKYTFVVATAVLIPSRFSHLAFSFFCVYNYRL
jgi:hypothetical protein